jgi:iron complex outermembrane receptor protein
MERQTGLSTNVADLERVEVLRGPQGSLYGRNSTAGAINFITEKPTGEFGIKQTFSGGNFGTVRSNTQVNLPEVEKLSVKLDFNYYHTDGWVHNDSTGANAGANFDYVNQLSGRAAFRWKPIADFTADYFVDYAREEYTPNYWQTTAPYFAPYSALLSPASPDRLESVTLAAPLPKSTLNATMQGLTLAWNALDSLTLKSLTGTRRTDNTNWVVYGGVPEGTLYSNAPHAYGQSQFTQEFQAIGNAGRDIQYTVGLFYFWENGSEYDTQDIGLPGPELGLPASAGFINLTVHDRYNQATNISKAAYTQATWTPSFILNGALHLTAGVRYTSDYRTTLVDQTESLTPPVAFSDSANARFHNTSPTFTAAYDVTDQVNVYAKYVQGYRSGGFNASATTPAGTTQPVQPELAKSYEIGTKSQWFDNRLRVNADIFYMHFKDLQFLFTDSSDISDARLVNAGVAISKGVELDVSARPLSDLLLAFHYGYTDVRYVEVIAPLTGINTADEYGQANTPHNSGNLDATYTLGHYSFGTLALNGNYMFTGAFSTTPARYPQSDVLPYSLLGARLNLSDIPVGDHHSARASLWVTNLTNKQYFIDNISVFPWSFRTTPFGPPRTYGVDLTYKF